MNDREQLLARTPASERQLELAGISTSVLEGGEGRPIVLLHEQGSFAAHWMRVIPSLVETNRVIAPDLPGHGASEIGDGALDADRVLAWLSEVIEHTCASPPVLVGHMAGGSIAARFAVEHGDRLSALVLVDSFGLGKFRPAPRFALALVRSVGWKSERPSGFLVSCNWIVGVVGLPWLLRRSSHVVARWSSRRVRPSASGWCKGAWWSSVTSHIA